MFILEIMSPSMKHSFNFDINGFIFNFLVFNLNLKRWAEPAFYVDILILNTIVLHHFWIEAKFKGDIIKSPNEFTFQVFDCRKDIALVTILLFCKLFYEILLFLV